MLQAIAEILFDAICYVVCGVIGEVILWVVTLGRRKSFEKDSDWSTLIGLVFWGLIVVGVVIFFIL